MCAGFQFLRACLPWASILSLLIRRAAQGTARGRVSGNDFGQTVKAAYPATLLSWHKPRMGRKITYLFTIHGFAPECNALRCRRSTWCCKNMATEGANLDGCPHPAYNGLQAIRRQMKNFFGLQNLRCLVRLYGQSPFQTQGAGAVYRPQTKYLTCLLHRNRKRTQNSMADAGSIP